MRVVNARGRGCYVRRMVQCYGATGLLMEGRISRIGYDDDMIEREKKRVYRMSNDCFVRNMIP